MRGKCVVEPVHVSSEVFVACLCLRVHSASKLGVTKLLWTSRPELLPFRIAISLQLSNSRPGDEMDVLVAAINCTEAFIE
jgi:hypothetical protein